VRITKEVEGIFTTTFNIGSLITSGINDTMLLRAHVSYFKNLLIK